MTRHTDISIVMLAHNGLHYSRLCLNSILLSDPLPAAMFLVDNGSSDTTSQLFAGFAKRASQRGIYVDWWRNEENRGCSAARNDAWAKAETEYVMFLDNDTVVRRTDWLQILAGELEADSSVGLVGPKLLYPHVPHPIQCAGIRFNPQGRVRFRGRGAAQHVADFAKPAMVDALISACWLMRNCLREKIGYLDELFHPVQYEDLDLCFRAIQAGYSCRYTPATELYHFEGKSTAAPGPATYHRVIAANSTKFRQKWRDTIRALPPDPADYRWLSDEELGLSDDIDLSLDE